MSSFTITTPEATVNLRPSSVRQGEMAKGTATYSVTNRTGATVRTGLRVRTGSGTEPGWFTVRDGEERDIAPGATTSFSVDLAVPGGSAKHSFNVVVVKLSDPDNDFEQGSTVAFDAPALILGGRENKFPYWIVAVAAGLLLLVGGAITVFVMMSGDNGDADGPTLPAQPAQPVGDVPFHSLVQESRIIAPDEFASFGIAEIKAAPSGSYCAEAVAAVTTQTKPGLTTGTVADIRRCTAVPLSIEFASAVGSVVVEFYGSVQEYPLTAFDASGAQVAAATQNGVLIYNQAPPAEISVSSNSANIKRIVFGRDTHGTLIHAIRFK
jgi:hypothetical protein